MKSKSFECLYSKVPSEQRDMLLDFRSAHPYKTIAIKGKTWRYISCGQGEKSLLLLPGAFMKADMWSQTAAYFEERYRIIIVDNYALQDTFDMRDICSAHVAILDAEGVQKTTAIGVSGGAGVVQFMFQDYPDRFENIVISHSGVVKPENDERLQKKIKLIRALPYTIVRRIMKGIVQKQWQYPTSSEWVEYRNAYLSEMGQALSRDVFIRFMEEGAKAHQEFVFNPETVRNFQGGFLILSSEGDGWAVDQVNELIKRYPSAQTYTFNEGGHHTCILFPTAYNQVLERFLDGTCS